MLVINFNKKYKINYDVFVTYSKTEFIYKMILKT